MGARMISAKQGFFYGWYFKCQSDIQTLAVIPAVHQTGQKRTCSIQIITETEAWAVEFPIEEFRRKGKTISIGRNRIWRGASGWQYMNLGWMKKEDCISALFPH